MREINFRGKSTKDNKWVYGDLIHTPSGGRRIIWFENTFSDSIDDYNDFNEEIYLISAGKTSRIKDKNKNMIYEGDILKITLYDDEWITTVRDYYGTLIIDVEGCEWNTTALSFLDDEAETEVIGNIHENPELLSTPTAVL